MSAATDAASQARVLSQAESFFESVVLVALYEGGVFKTLGSGALSFDEIQARCECDGDCLTSALDAGVHFKILAFNDGRYRSMPDYARCLGDEQSPAFVGQWLSFMGGVARGMTEAAPRLAKTRSPTAFQDVVGAFQATSHLMTRGVGEYERSRAEELAHRLPLEHVTTIIDLGCGEGHLVASLLKQHPSARATLVDRKEVLPRARKTLEEADCASRASFVSADIQRESLSQTADVVVISNVLHMLGPEASQSLIQRATKLLSPGGLLLIAGQMLEQDRRSPRWPVVANLLMVASTPRGRNHSAEEAMTWLRDAGLAQVEQLPLSPWNSNTVVFGRL